MCPPWPVTPCRPRSPPPTPTATWYLRNENSAGAPDAGQFPYGFASWKPVVGDWDGNGTKTVGMVDTTGTTNIFNVWYLRNSNSAGPADITITFGLAGWIPV